MRVYHPNYIPGFCYIYIICVPPMNFAHFYSVRSFIAYKKARYVKRGTIFLHKPGYFFRKGCLCFCIVVGCLVIEQ